MKFSCSYCGKIHEKNYDCGCRPKRRSRYEHSDNEAGRYSYAFTRKSREIKERSFMLCAVCFDEGIITSKDLETHHIVKLRDDPDLLLDDNNLICLCRRHHELADSGQLDAGYLRQLAARRDASDSPVLAGLEAGRPLKTTLPPK